MSRKNIAVIAFFALIIIFAGALILKNISSESADKQEVKEDVDWNSLVSEIKIILRQEFGEEEGLRQIDIFKQADITGDGISEALVYTGSGGAYTDELTLVRIEEFKPVLAQFKQENGEVSGLVFLSGASVRHGEAVDLIPEESAIYSASWSLTETGEIETCSVDVYEWKEETKLFEFDLNLSDISESGLCKNLFDN